MTENEAKSYIQGKLDCMNKCDVFDCKGTDECENCNYCYSQGNFGEQKKAFEMAIQSLEKVQQYEENVKNKHIGKDNMVISSSDLMTILNSDEKEIRNKAIDEFAEKLRYELNGNIIPDKEKFKYTRKQQEQICHQNMTLKRAIKYVDYIAEQLKGGE